MGEHNLGGGQAALPPESDCCAEPESTDNFAGCLLNKPPNGLEKMVGTPVGLRNQRAAASQRA